MRYFSKCLNQTGETKERRECGGLRVGNVVEFDIILKAVECPKDPKDWQQTIRIKPRGVNESLIIELDLICECPCAKPGHPVSHVNYKSLAKNLVEFIKFIEINFREI